MIVLKVDNREVKVKDYIKVPYILENLEHGDYQIFNDETPLLIIERKTICDLASSVKDGRYKNQKIALLEKFPSSMLYYVIEGDFDFIDSESSLYGLSKKTIISCVINTMIRDNIKVITTKNMINTVELISGIYNRVKENPEKYSNSSNSEQIITHNIKEKDLTCNKLFIKQLCQIPCISGKTAEAISLNYASMADFVLTLNLLSTVAEKMKELSKIKLTNNKRIASSAVTNILKYVFDE